MPTVVLVHGLWHGTWCWSRVTEQLAGRGVASVAVDLEGHGFNSRNPAARWGRPFSAAAFAAEPSGSTGVTASTAAAVLVDQIRTIGAGEPCLVVAHSHGGTVVTAAAEMAPALFAHLVYIAAFAPVTGLPSGAYVTSPENEGEQATGLLRADPRAVGGLRIDTGDRDGHAAIREAFYGDVDEATATAAISLLGSDGPLGIATDAFTVTAGRYGAIPRTYVVCTQDNTIRPALQHRFIREIDELSSTPTRVVELNSSHSPFLSQPAAVARVIAEIC